MFAAKWYEPMGRAVCLTALLLLALPGQAQLLNKNLIINGGAEDRPGASAPADLQTIPPGWTLTGDLAVANYGGFSFLTPTDFGPFDRGSRFFYGGLSDQRSTAMQVLDLSASAADIDTGRIRFNLSGYLGYIGNPPDSVGTTCIRAEFLDAAGEVLLAATAAGPQAADVQTISQGLLLRTTTGYLPPGTRKTRIIIDLANDSTTYYAADNISFVLTDDPLLGANLVVNGDVETILKGADPADARPIPGWNVNAACTVRRYGDPAVPVLGDPLPAELGQHLLLCPSMQAVAAAYQAIDISAAHNLVDSGGVSYSLSAWLGGPGNAPDNARLQLTFFDGSNPPQALGLVTLEPVTATDLGSQMGLRQRSATGAVPAGTRLLHIDLIFNRLRADSEPNSGVADNISLVLDATVLSTVLNAASAQLGDGIAPGEMVTLLGDHLGPQTGVKSSIGLEKRLGGTTVTFNGIEAYLSYASSIRIDAVVPYGVYGNADVVVYGEGQQTDRLALAVVDSAPGIFAQENGLGQARVVNQDQSANSAANPARHGSRISLRATGQGAVTPSGADGEFIIVPKNVASPVKLTVGGVDATGISARLIQTGEIQVDATVPANAPAGDAELLLTIGRSTSRKGVTIAIAADTPNPPQLTAITTSPNPPVAGQPFNFTVSGTNFDPSAAIVYFSGPGCDTPCSISGLTASATQLTSTATIATAGSFLVTVRNGVTGAAANSIALTISAPTPAPQLTAINTSPSPPVAGQAFNFTLAGANFDPATAIVYFSGPGCTTPCTAAGLAGTTSLLNGAATLPAPGNFIVTLRNGANGAASNGLALVLPVPAIKSIRTTPDPPLSGQLFKFSVTGINFDPTTAIAYFSGPGCSTPCSATGLFGSATQVTGSIVLQGGTFTVSIQNGATGTPSNSISLRVQSVTVTPTLTNFSTVPAPPLNGRTFFFTINGTNFDPSSTVYFSGPGCSTPCTPTSVSVTSTQLSGLALLSGNGTFSLTVRNGANGAPSNALTFTVSPQLPVISSITTLPNPPVAGLIFAFSISGTNLDPSTALVDFVGTGCAPCTFGAKFGSSMYLIGQGALPSGSFAVSVRMGLGGVSSNSLSLAVQSAVIATGPQLNSLTTTPSQPVGGQSFSFTITGTAFNPATAVAYFSGPGCATPCSVSGLTGSSTQVSGSTTLSGGAFTVTVANSAGGVSSNSLSLTVSGNGGGGGPQLSSISTAPAAPAAGQSFTFTITGTGLTPATAVAYFSGPGCATPCSISGLTGSSTQVSGSTTLSGGTYAVTVANSAGGAASNSLSLTVSGGSSGGIPQLSSISTAPSAPVSGQPFTFTITGTVLTPATAVVYFSGPGCATPCSATGLTGSSTQVSGSTTLAGGGTFTVTVANTAGGTASNSLSLTVLDNNIPPQLTSIATGPNPPVAGQPFLFSVTGTGFIPETLAVYFSGPGCTSPCSPIDLTGSSTQVFGRMTLSSGTYSVTVTNKVGGAASNSLSLTVPIIISSPVPQLSGLSTSPSPPLPGKAFNFTITGTNFDPATALVFFAGLPGCAVPCSALSVTGTSTQLSGSAVLSSGSFSVTVQNGSEGRASNTLSLTVPSGAGTPQLTKITTTPSPAVTNTWVTFTITGTSFNPAKAFVSFLGPDCNPCNVAIDPGATPTQLTGSWYFSASGPYTVTVQNGSTGPPSNALTLDVLMH